MSNHTSEKRKQFEQRKTGVSGRFIAIGIIAVIIIVGGIIWLGKRGKENTVKVESSSIEETVSYKGETIEMTEVVPKIEDGKIKISTEVVKENKLVYFDVEEVKYPLLAYVAPSGKIITAVSVCEPCRSDKFHIEGNELVCNACWTKWTLEGLKGISGGCKQYPPDALANTQEGDYIIIDKSEVENWKPRV